MNVTDTLINLVAQIGAGKAKTTADQFAINSMDEGQLEAMYRGDWVARKACDIPVADMLRPWREWQAKPDLITAMEAAEKRHHIKDKVEQLLRWARLYGGAGLYIGDGNREVEKPFVPTAVKKGGIKYIQVLPRHALKVDELDYDIGSPNFMKPKSYTLALKNGSISKVHHTRVIRAIGNEIPGHNQNIDGWGDSVLQVVRDAVHHFALASAAGAELLHEAKIDVIKIPELGSMLSTTTGTEQVSKRFAAAAMLKSINNVMLLGSNEEYDRKQTSFSGLHETIRMYLQIVAGATDIPATRLAGQSPGGLNASGDSDTRNYYDMLEGVREKQVRSILEQLDVLMWLDETGAVPTDAYFDFGPLWQPTEAEKATTSKSKAETTKLYVDMGLIDEDILAVGVANQLIEDGIYPGVEKELAAVQSAPDGFGEDPEEGSDPPADNPKRNRRE